MYLTYSEYKDFGGTLEETDFQNLEYDAESTINWFTFNRLRRKEWEYALETPELKRCMYQLIRNRQAELELLASGSGEAGWGVGWKKEAGIVEESNDGVRTRYNVASSGDLLAYYRGASSKEEVIKMYMGSIVNDLGRNILYKGVYPGE